MTYRQLKERLNELTEEQLGMFVTVIIQREFDEFEIRNIEETRLASEITNLDRADFDFESYDIHENLPCLFVVSGD